MTLGADDCPWILRLDIAGFPVAWLNWQATACLYAREQVVWSLGEVVRVVRGGRSRFSAKRTELPIQSVIACRGSFRRGVQGRPKLSNRALFIRDEYACLYCGASPSRSELTRDHVLPKSRGGKDSWLNCVTACRSCNCRKGNRTLEESGLRLLAVPYCPNFAEYLALCNAGRILGDQMDMLRPRFSTPSPGFQARFQARS